MTDLKFSNPSTLRISARKYVITLEEGNNFDCSLLIKQRNNRVTVELANDTLSNCNEKFFFNIDELNQIFYNYDEDILYDIIEFLYTHSFIKENVFMEKILLLHYKYSIEFIMSSLNSMDIQQLEQIFFEDNTLYYFELYIYVSIFRKADSAPISFFLYILFL